MLRVSWQVSSREIVRAPDQQDPECLNAVVLDELVESDTASHRNGLGRGTHRTADETRLDSPLRPITLLKFRTGLSSKLSREPVQFEASAIGEAVFVPGPTACRTEGIRFDDVGSGLEVDPMDIEDDIRTGLRRESRCIPSRSSPPKSAGPRSRRTCIAVPVAPSRTRMRSVRAASSERRATLARGRTGRLAHLGEP